jgi:methylmalonyl-CoA mutase cobalamin-binding domain/chain
MALDEITDLLIDLDVDNISDAVQQALDNGIAPQDILKALTTAMNEVGKRYEEGEYFLTELVLAGETMKEAFVLVQPHLKSEVTGTRSPVVLATVKGDNHDIGKNILSTMLVSAGFEVIDLGIDVSENEIVEAVKTYNPKVVALSSLLTMTVNEISKVNEALIDAGLRERVKLIVGGAPLNMELAKKLGADDFGADAIEGVKRIRNLMDV